MSARKLALEALHSLDGEHIDKAIAALRAELAQAVEPAGWHTGIPPHPYDKEWFIANTVSGEKVVLRALPEDFAYDFRTADETYMMAASIKRWMQFPDSDFIPFTAPQEPAAPEPVGWQPIETAPDDGRESLFYTKEMGAVVMYWDSYLGRWETGFADRDGLGPTHWRPLPTAPGGAA